MVEEVSMVENEMDGSSVQSETASRNTTRAQEEREGLSREAILEAIEDNDWLKIPQSVKDQYRSEGYVLRWVRVMLDGQDDYQNIGRKEREGWKFVMAEECPELSSGFRVQEDGRMTGCILRGDVALAKQPIEYAQAMTDAVQKRTNEMEQAISNRLHGDHPDRRMPITDSSKSRVSTGQRARFDA